MNWMTVLEDVVLVEIWVGAIAYSLFVACYLVWARRSWWTTRPGRAVLVASLSSALLLDLTLVLRVVEVSPLAGLAITAGVVGLIALGGVLKLTSLGLEIVGSWRSKR